MGESLNQPSRVQDDGPSDFKLRFYEMNRNYVKFDDRIIGISIG